MVEKIGIVSFLFVLASIAGLVNLQPKNRHIAIAFLNLVFAAWAFQYGAFVFPAVAAINYVLFRNPKLFYLGFFTSLLPLVLVRWPGKFEFRDIFFPISLCFFSLQQIGTWADLRFERTSAPRSFLLWLCYSTFFPSLFAGPITRWSSLSVQLENPTLFTKDTGWRSLHLFLQAVFKMSVFAVPLQVAIDLYFANPLEYGPIATILIAVTFRFFLWAEISAQTDWARAASAMIGIELPENFNRPFQQLTLSDFWRRWHMTVSFWLRDYVFFPLAMGRLRRLLPKEVVLPVAVLVTFAIFGLWHGLTFSLLVMGLWKGFGVVVSERPLRFFKENTNVFIREVFGRLLFFATFVIFVCLPTLLLKIEWAPAVELFSTDFARLLSGDQKWLASLSQLFGSLSEPDGTHYKLLLWLFAVLLWQVLEFIHRREETRFEASAIGSTWPVALRSALIVGLFVLWILVGGFGSEFQFSYAN